LSIDDTRKVDFLAAPVLAPLPSQLELPNGAARLVVLTRITRDEMDFARKNGVKALIKLLEEAGVGQVSAIDRPSVLPPN
jgi:hypothetical protein